MSADMGQFDARKTTPSSKEAQDQVFAKFKQRRVGEMKKFEVLVMAQQYYTVYIDAESIEDAHKQAWDNVGQIIMRDADDYEVEVRVEGEVK